MLTDRRTKGVRVAASIMTLAALATTCGCAQNDQLGTTSAGPPTSMPPYALTSNAKDHRSSASLRIPGVTFRYPRTWRSTTYPYGITPGPTLQIDVLTTPSGRTVTWLFDAQHTALGYSTTTIAGRRVVRRSLPASRACAKHGGTREEIVALSTATAPRTIRELVVLACIRSNATSPSPSEINAMLISLRSIS